MDFTPVTTNHSPHIVPKYDYMHWNMLIGQFYIQYTWFKSSRLVETTY